jgi:hypothetical protein
MDAKSMGHELGEQYSTAVQPPPVDPRLQSGFQPPPFDHGPAAGLAPQKSWASRHTGLVVGLGCGALLVLLCLFVAGIFGIVTTAVRSSDAYQIALSTASRDTAVLHELGSPIEAGWFPTGQINVAGSTGHANLGIPISGPLRSGSIAVVADKVGGKWKFSTLSVAVHGRPAAIDLLPALPTP